MAALSLSTALPAATPPEKTQGCGIMTVSSASSTSSSAGTKHMPRPGPDNASGCRVDGDDLRRGDHPLLALQRCDGRIEDADGAISARESKPSRCASVPTRSEGTASFVGESSRRCASLMPRASTYPSRRLITRLVGFVWAAMQVSGRIPRSWSRRVRSTHPPPHPELCQIRARPRAEGEARDLDRSDARADTVRPTSRSRSGKFGVGV